MVLLARASRPRLPSACALSRPRKVSGGRKILLRLLAMPLQLDLVRLEIFEPVLHRHALIDAAPAPVPLGLGHFASGELELKLAVPGTRRTRAPYPPARAGCGARAARAGSSTACAGFWSDTRQRVWARKIQGGADGGTWLGRAGYLAFERWRTVSCRSPRSRPGSPASPPARPPNGLHVDGDAGYHTLQLALLAQAALVAVLARGAGVPDVVVGLAAHGRRRQARLRVLHLHLEGDAGAAGLEHHP
jgi:hypothetical protein